MRRGDKADIGTHDRASYLRRYLLNNNRVNNRWLLLVLLFILFIWTREFFRDKFGETKEMPPDSFRNSSGLFNRNSILNIRECLFILF